MKITISEKNVNPLLGRTEVSGELDYEGVTPSNVQLAERLAKEFNVDSSLVVVKHIYTKFSQQMADFLAFVYDNKETRDKAERMTKHMKKEAEAGKKAEEEKKEEAPVEKKEEKPEEPKEEEKPEEKEKSKEEKKEDIPTAEDLIKETQEKFAGEDKEKEKKKKDEEKSEGGEQ